MFDRSIPVIGFHTRLYEHEGTGAMIRLIEEGLVPNGINTLILEYLPVFRCFPEYSMGTVTYEDAREISDVCRKHGIRLVPLFPCQSHQSRPGTHYEPFPLLKQHPEFIETTDEPGAGKLWPYRHMPCWCGSNDEIYRYVFPMIDEMAEACRADTVHIGMDEMMYLGCCPRCKGKDIAKLYAHTIKILHDHLKDKGLDTMIWGDRLLPSQEMGYTMWEGDRFGTYRAIDMEEITRDLIICDWHYDYHSHGYPSIEFWLKRGFFMIPSVWIDPKQAQHLFLHALEGVFLGNRFSWPGVMSGILFTHWTSLTDDLADRILKGIHGEKTDDEDESNQVGLVIAALKDKVAKISFNERL